jgi:ubiquinone/menaquinone biosynthesis C-methylase UbiE
MLFIFVTIGGSVLLSAGDVSLGGMAIAGDLFALLGSAAVAGYMLIGRFLRRSLSARTYVFLVYGSSAIFLILFCLITGTPIARYSLRNYLLFAAMAFFCTILGHTLFNWALKYLKTSYVATIVLGEPIFATILGLIIFTEIPPALTIAGGAVMLVGLIGFVREENGVKDRSDFDAKAKQWDDNPVQVERNRAIAEGIRRFVPLEEVARALDYGAGTGLLAFDLAADLAEIVALDTSEGMLEVLKDKISSTPTKARITPRYHDLSAEPLDDGEFDFVFTAMTLHHVGDVPLVMHRFSDLLKPGGYLAVADLEPEDGSFHQNGQHVHHRGFDTAGLTRIAEEAGFTDLRSDRIYQIERGDSGKRYGVFLLVGRKA